MDEPTMYILVNKDLKMRTGKIAAQVGHGAIYAFLSSRKADSEFFHRWWKTSQKKVVLYATGEMIQYLNSKYPTITHPVIDEGRTQIEPGSLTVLSFDVVPSCSLPELKELKLV